MQKIHYSSTSNHFAIILLLISMGVSSRVLLHIPNVTALTSISILAAMYFSRITAISLVILTLMISDILLAQFFHYPIVGTWTLFTYSGFLGITFLCKKYQPNTHARLFRFLISSSLLFWLWTNFGVWLCADMYSKTLSGLINCYFAALPFLRNQCLGDLAWMVLLLSAFRLAGFYFKSKQSLASSFAGYKN